MGEIEKQELRNLNNLIKRIYLNFTANMLNCERLHAFPPRWGIGQGWRFVPTSAIQHYAGSSIQWNRAREGNKRHRDWKWWDKTVFFCRWHDGLCYFSVAQLYPTLCNPMDCSMPGFPALQCLLDLAQTHVHWVGDAIQPSHPLTSPSPAFNLSQHQGLFQWVSSLH